MGAGLRGESRQSKSTLVINSINQFIQRRCLEAVCVCVSVCAVDAHLADRVILV